MSYHRDNKVNKAMIRLMDTLCTWERETGRGSKLFLIPDEDDEKIIFAMDGKPVSWTPMVLIIQSDLIKSRLQDFMRARKLYYCEELFNEWLRQINYNTRKLDVDKYMRQAQEAIEKELESFKDA